MEVYKENNKWKYSFIEDGKTYTGECIGDVLSKLHALNYARQTQIKLHNKSKKIK